MGKNSNAPAPPDPSATAAAQTDQNISTAIAQQQLNNVNQVTPYGSLTYEQTGTYDFTDPNTGQVRAIPQYTATQTLSPEQQAIQDLNFQTNTNLATIGRDQSGRIGDLLATPVDLSNEAVEGRLMELGRSRLDPALDRRREQQRNSLIQQGFTAGSEGYNRAMEQVSRAENDAYNQLLLSGRGQAVQETLAQRNQPINEITALLSGSQISQPSFVGTNPAQIANVDRAGLEMANYNGRLANWQAGRARQDAMLGGLFGLGSSAIMAI